MSALRQRLSAARRDESGFTLVELLVATLIGMVIILAAFGLADSSVRAFGKADNRADVVQRGRSGLDIIGRTLRSQTCPVGANSTATNTIGAFVLATNTKAVFWTDLSRKASTTRPADPSLDGFSYSNGTISELSYSGNVLTGTETAVAIIPGVIPNLGDTSAGENASDYLFKYYRFNPSYDPNAAAGTANSKFYSQIPTPIADADLSDIVQVRVAFKTYPRKSTASDKTTATFSDQANLPTADPSLAEAPAC